MQYDILVVGSGGHAVNHWLGQINIHGGFKVSGVVDIDTELLDRAGKIWGVPDDAVATTIDEAIEAGIKADVALICAPIGTHHGLAIEAMRNGLHVICEKNMAHSMQAGLEMTRCAVEHPELATVVGHQYPYWRRSNWAIRKAIGTGQLGRLGSIQCDFNPSGYWNPGNPTRSGWRRFLDHDYLEDWAVHTLDLFRYYTAMDAVVVSADLWRPSWSRRYGTTSINIRMKMAAPREYEGDVPLACSGETDRARRLWKEGKTPDTWIHAQYVGHAEGMGLFDSGEHWMIQGTRGSLEYMEGGYQKDRPPVLRVITHDFDVDGAAPGAKLQKGELAWKESDLQPYPTDLECGPAAQWKGNNSEDEFDNNCFILEEVKQCIESGGKVKPLRCFENCIKTFAITMGAIESSKRGGEPVFLPDLWEVPRG
ncbi:MAG: Gfo/Idh/MocA family oxidoreductase [Candidatus Lokiarchaeota archaeon]|nr:Gfo/Idh/MocA family oxidoreductase [Candidatus Lokiarchaeota archaeon]